MCKPFNLIHYSFIVLVIYVFVCLFVCLDIGIFIMRILNANNLSRIVISGTTNALGVLVIDTPPSCIPFQTTMCIRIASAQICCPAIRYTPRVTQKQNI